MICWKDTKPTLIASIKGRKCEVDVQTVKVFSVDEWNNLHKRINFERDEAAALKSNLVASEQIKKKSQELHRDWTNTYLGARAKKLRDRKERIEREEQERQLVDREWAKIQADERKKKLCEARTLQYYKTAPLMEFHSALGVGDVQRERELQIQLKEKKNEYDRNKKDEDYQKLLRQLKEEEVKEQKKIKAIKAENVRIHEFQHSQILEHQRQALAEKTQYMADGEEIRRLAREAEARQKQLLEDQVNDRKLTKKDLLEDIELRKRLRLVDKIKEEELEEEIRIYAAAKRKMKILQIEREMAIAKEKNVAEAKTQDKLADILRQQHGNEEERIARAIQEEANRWDVRMHRESAKRQKDLAEIWEHRHATIEARVQQLREQVKEDKADLARRIALDQKAQKEDEDLRAERLARGRELAKLYHEEMIRSDEKRKRERQTEIEWSKEFDKQTLTQDKLFQDYAKRVIAACEKSGVSTYAMKKTAKKNVIDGLGTNLIGEVGSNPADTDPNCVPLPNLPDAQEHVEQ